MVAAVRKKHLKNIFFQVRRSQSVRGEIHNFETISAAFV